MILFTGVPCNNYCSQKGKMKPTDSLTCLPSTPTDCGLDSVTHFSWMEYDSSDSVWLLQLGPGRHMASSWLSLVDHLFCEKPAALRWGHSSKPLERPLWRAANASCQQSCAWRSGGDPPDAAGCSHVHLLSPTSNERFWAGTHPAKPLSNSWPTESEIQ